MWLLVTNVLREVLTRKKKKCEISHFWSRPLPPPKKCQTWEFFFSHINWNMFWWKVFKFQDFPLIWSKIVTFRQRGTLPPILKKNFFAALHDLGHERKKIKKSVKMTQFCPDPPSKCEISHFFFWVRPSLRFKNCWDLFSLHEIFEFSPPNHPIQLGFFLMY